MKFISLRTKIIIATIVFILLPISVVGIYTYREFEKVLTQNIAESASETLEQININIERQLKAIMNASSSVVLDDQIRKVLNHPPTSDKEIIESVDQIDKKVLEISTSIVTDTVYITIIDNKGNYYTNWPQTASAYTMIEQSEFYRKAEEQNGFMSWEMNHANYVNPNGENLVTLAMMIRDTTFSDNIGMLLISEPVSTYLNILHSGFSGHLGFIMDRENHLLTENDAAAIDEVFPYIEDRLRYRKDGFSYEVQGAAVEVFTNYIPLTEWLIVQVVPHDSIYDPISQIRNTAITTLFISLTIFILLMMFISTMITRSLKKLQLAMSEVEAGNLNVSFTVSSRDEAGRLGRSFAKMLKRLQYHIDNEIILESSKEKAKLEALQAQINPHFLHNTLNTIKMMSIMAGTKNITEMLLSLGHLLNMSIHRGQELITVREELSNVQSFLTIQKYRFGDTIEVIEHIDEEAWDALVPKLSLQPLVENVYQHGLFIEGGTMIIQVHKQGDELWLKVLDNGEPPNQDHLREVNKRLRGEKSEKFSSVGLYNVHKRIQMMFGSHYGLTITRHDDSSTTCVSIHLPYRRSSHEISNRNY